MDEKKVLLSIKDLEVQFHVRGRILTAIRGISLDIYENESIAIVGESGSGKSVFTKTFAGMLDSNGFISKGSIILNDDTLADTVVDYSDKSRKVVANALTKLNEYSKLELGAATYKEMRELEAELEKKSGLPEEVQAEFEAKMNDATHDITELQNYRQTLADKEEIKKTNEKIKALEADLKKMSEDLKAKTKAAADAVKNDSAYMSAYNRKMEDLKNRYASETKGEISAETKA
ncbi:MAG: ATP-binding cassette domain-containing protein, partial [Erysipelotrichaceae bacterium]|nr:ATP-binding cassette domain-containing protein [Erysipelotrichaceae bacterium]